MTTLDDRPTVAHDSALADALAAVDRLDAAYHTAINTHELDDGEIAIGVLADLDLLIATARMARDQVGRHVARLPIWHRKVIEFPVSRLRAERNRSSNRKWDTARVWGRIAPHIAGLVAEVDEATGEVRTLPVELVERVLLAAAAFLPGSPAFRVTPFKDGKIPFDDIAEGSDGSYSVRVTALPVDDERTEAAKVDG